MPNAFEKTTLPNGLRVVTADMPQAKSVACFVMLAAGSRYETRTRTGSRTSPSTCSSRGPRTGPTARDIAGEIDSIGGEFNAFTGKEYTGYYVKCAAEHRDTALDVLVDMLRHSKFDPEEIEREKGVIVEEMNMYYDTPRDYVDGVYDELLYGDQPLGWDIIGTKETVRAATRETFLDYLDRWYRGAAHGRRRRRARSASDAVDRVAALLGDVPNGATGEPAPGRLASRTRRGSSSTRSTSDQAHVRIGVHSYPIGHPDRYALMLLATVLGGGMSSRLFTEVRERRGLAYYIYGYNQGYTDTGTLFAQGGVDIDRIDDAVATIVGEFGRIAAEPVERGRAGEGAQLRQGPARALARGPEGDDHLRPARRGARGPLREPDEVLAGLDAVTLEDIQRVAQDIIREDRLNLALIGPFDEPGALPEAPGAGGRRLIAA